MEFACLLSKQMRKVTHGIIIHPWNYILFMANLFIYSFKCSLHVFLKNGMVRKISKTKVWPGIDVLLLCHEKLYGNQLQGVNLSELYTF